MNKKIKLILIVTTLSLAILITLFVLMNGTYMVSTYDPLNDKFDDEMAYMTETQFELIRSGLMAASSHNMQPWKVKILDNKSFMLYADLSKKLAVVDPSNWQLMVGQGTFIGSMKAFADQNNIKLEIEYLDLPENGNLKPIGRFTILERGSIKADVISSSSIASGESKDPLIVHLESIFKDSQFGYSIVSESDKLKLQTYLREATIIESRNQAAVEELIQDFRFTKRAQNNARFGLMMQTMPNWLETFVGPIMASTVAWEGFGEQSIKMFDDRLRVEDAYLLIHREAMTAMDYIKLGELIDRISRVSSEYQIRPAVQLLQDIEGMHDTAQAFQIRFGQNNVVMILGIQPMQDNDYEVMRHRVMDVLIVD